MDSGDQSRRLDGEEEGWVGMLLTEMFAWRRLIDQVTVDLVGGALERRGGLQIEGTLIFVGGTQFLFLNS